MTTAPAPRVGDVLGERADVVHAFRIVRPAEEGCRLHVPGATHWTILYVATGRVGFQLRDARIVVDPGDVLIFRRDRLIRSGATDGARIDCLHICFEAARDWSPSRAFERRADHAYAAAVRLSSTRQQIRDAFGRVRIHAQIRFAAHAVESAGAPRSNATPQPVDGGIRRELMLMALREILLLVESDLAGASGLDARVREALEIMGRDLAAPHSLASLGRACNLSPSRFAQLFRDEVGVSPIRALRRMRLRQVALELQYTGDTVERIAEETGFTSLSHLSREFRRAFGVSPRAYRARVAVADSL